MDKFKIDLISPANCNQKQLDDFVKLVISGGQVAEDGLGERISRADTLAFAYDGDNLAGIAALKNQKRSYVTKIFLNAKIPRRAELYPVEIGYAVTHENYRRKGISITLFKTLIDNKPQLKCYATTKNEGMCDLLERIGFVKAGQSYQNAAGETLTLYLFN